MEREHPEPEEKFSNSDEQTNEHVDFSSGSVGWTKMKVVPSPARAKIANFDDQTDEDEDFS